MRWLAYLSLALLLPALAAEDSVRKTVHSTKDFGQRVALPALDKGHLLFVGQPLDENVSLYAPDGRKVFEATVRTPAGSSIGPMDAALDTDGTVAVGAGNFYGGAIVLLDASGKQIRFTSTGRYMPARICFDQEHTIWAFGSQRDLVKNDSEDREDYFMVRRFSKDGKELGSFLLRSGFPGWANPFGAHRGLWQVRAADGKIGALAYPGHEGYQPEWVELDLAGNLIGRWNLGPRLYGGRAYTADGRLYARKLDEKKRARLFLFDRTSSSWIPVDDDLTVAPGLLLGADGNDLVFAEDYGLKLSWVRPGR